MGNRVSGALAALAAAIVSACANVPITSMPRLAALDPKTLDPARIEVAVRAPEAVEVTQATLTYQFRNARTEEVIDDTLTLQRVDAGLTPFLSAQSRRGTRIERFRLTPEQARGLAAGRETAMAWDAEGQRQFTLGAGATLCLKPDANPFRELKFTIYLREDPSRDFFTLVGERALDLDRAKRCPA